MTPRGASPLPKGRWLVVDPGETTGWSVWKGDKMLGGGQTPLWEFAHGVWDTLFDAERKRKQARTESMYSSRRGLIGTGDKPWLGPNVTPEDNTGPITLIVCERFALYPDKAADLAWDEFRTVQLIGALTFMATLCDVEMHKQPASIKGPAEAAGAREFFVRPIHENRHQNDSIMHAFFYLAVECRGATIEVPDGTED